MSQEEISKTKYEPEKCLRCGQTETYLLAIDQGTVDIVKAISAAIRKKEINAVHPRKEMETSQILERRIMIAEGMLTSNQVGNLSRPRFHGLIAAVKGNPGNYCMTEKGANFLRKENVPQYAIISKRGSYHSRSERPCAI